MNEGSGHECQGQHAQNRQLHRRRLRQGVCALRRGNRAGRLAQGDVGRLAGVAAVATAGSLMAPSAALAAECVNVGGTQYNAGTAAGDDAGTWAWDGADDMKLNGYNGGAIKAAGKLNIAYEGKNTVKTEPDYTGAAIKAQNGTSQKAELNITSSNSTDELNVTAEADAINPQATSPFPAQAL